MPHDDSAFAGTAISKPPPCSCYLHGGLCFTCGECKPPSTKTRQREERREVRRSSSCLTSLSAFVCESGVSPCKPSWLLHKHTIIWEKRQGVHSVCRHWGRRQQQSESPVKGRIRQPARSAQRHIRRIDLWHPAFPAVPGRTSESAAQ